MANEARQVVPDSAVGSWLAMTFAPVEIGLREFVECGGVRRDGDRIGHHLVELGERLFAIFSQVDLLSAGGEVPALGVLVEAPLWLPSAWGDSVSCMKSAFAASRVRSRPRKVKDSLVGMTRFELATSAPPVQRSNQAEPHPDRLSVFIG